MSVKTDEELIKDIKEGDIEAFGEIVRRYQQRLVIFVYHIINDEHESEDVVSQSLFKVYKTIERVDTRKRFSSYIYQIAKNEAISYLRSRKYTVSLKDLELIDEDETVYEKLARKDDIETINNAVKKIEKRYQRVIKLYYFEDLSYEEIGEKLKLPVNTVRTHLRRAKEALKKYIPYEKD